MPAIVRFLLVVGLLSNGAAVADSGVAFQQPSYGFSVNVGANRTVPLATLLSKSGSGDLNWGFLGSVPSWISLDRNTGVLSLNPDVANLGQTQFSVVVSDRQNPNEGGVIEPFTITVTDAPNW